MSASRCALDEAPGDQEPLGRDESCRPDLPGGCPRCGLRAELPRATPLSTGDVGAIIERVWGERAKGPMFFARLLAVRALLESGETSFLSRDEVERVWREAR